ncbi:membrane protein insertion efficiency factor YidD [Candidatus Microgenomates bacterium]|nr:MAG: membrane protein insertion efficiency factor YidD [Candidatus Microgenomates bacterium]
MKKALIVPLSIYRRLLSRLIVLLMGGGCRFQPTCSEYAKDSLEKHGVVRGTLLTAARLLRCHPWGGSGYDPVPERK